MNMYIYISTLAGGLNSSIFDHVSVVEGAHKTTSTVRFVSFHFVSFHSIPLYFTFILLLTSVSFSSPPLPSHMRTSPILQVGSTQTVDQQQWTPLSIFKTTTHRLKTTIRPVHHRGKRTHKTTIKIIRSHIWFQSHWGNVWNSLKLQLISNRQHMTP